MSKVIITGPTCSGKSYLKRKFVQKGFRPIVQFTTRKSREGEYDGYDYDFCTDEQYNILRRKTEIVTSFRYENGTTYGITEPRWNNGDVIALGLMELLQLAPEILNSCFIIYLNPSEKVIRERIQERGDSPEEAERRIQSDKRDYHNFKLYDIQITKPKDINI